MSGGKWSRAEIEKVKRRWTSGQREAVLQSLRMGAQVESPFGLTESGMMDLRGLELFVSSESAKSSIKHEILSGQLQLNRVELENLDFSHAHMPHMRMQNVRINNCRFDGVSLSDLRLWATDVDGSSFVGAKFDYASLRGALDGMGCAFTNTSFAGADLRRAFLSDATFFRCDFSDSKLSGIVISDAKFDGSTFAGLFYDVTFQNSGSDTDMFRDVDFSEAKFRFVDFRNFNFQKSDNMVWPMDPNHIVVTKVACVLDEAVRFLESTPGEIAARVAKILARKRGVIGERQDVGCLSRYDFAEKNQDETALRLFDRVVDSAISICGAEVLSGSRTIRQATSDCA
jgi:uncharacterized protein YjbI with pentapeptide repeats